MRPAKLLALATSTMFVFCALAASAAFAESTPTIICLVANCAEALEVKLTGGESKLETLKGFSIESVKAEMTVLGLASCELSGERRSISLCKDVLLSFESATTQSKKVSCRSEVADGTDKAPLKTILALLDLHLAAEETKEKLLRPLLLAKVLGPLLENELTINCGGVKSAVKGVVGCLLLPGLAEVLTTTEVELLCQIKEKDPETGTCDVLCKWLAEFTFLSNLSKEFEDAWMLIQLKGKFSADVWIDD
jgi:hypothetical protein